MERPSHAHPAPISDRSGVSDVARLAPSPPARIVTRRFLPRTRLGEGHRVLTVEDQKALDSPVTGIATRRMEWHRRRRAKQLLMAVAIVLAVFPPVWVVYLVAWLVWRTRPRQRSMRNVRGAVRALARNQTGVALKHLQEAHLLDPANNDALYWLGLLLSRQHRHEEAEEALSLVAQRVPGLPEVEAALVDAYVATGEPENAVYHAQRLQDAAPYETETLLKLADAFEAAGRLDMAIQALEQAPIHKRTLNEALLEVHYRLGILYERKGEGARALKHFERVFARDITYKDVRSRVEALGAGLTRK